NRLLLYLIEDLVEKHVCEFFGPRPQIVGFLHVAKYYLAELRMNSADSVDHISKEDSKIKVGGVNLIPDVRNVGISYEFVDQSGLAASGVCAHNRDWKVDLPAEALKQPRPLEQSGGKAWRHQLCPQEVLWQSRHNLGVWKILPPSNAASQHRSASGVS